MTSADHKGFTLENFEGTLDLLVYLIQKNELDIGEVPIREITSQYLKRLQDEIDSFDTGGDFLLSAASLLLLKSESLIPGTRKPTDENPDPRLDMLQHVIDYCQLKDKAIELSDRELTPMPYYPRGKIEKIPEMERGSGVEHLSLQSLVDHLERALSRDKEIVRSIAAEEWKVEHALQDLRNDPREAISLSEIFSADKPRGQLIVFFLAILEMMKFQEVQIVGDQCQKK